jgi:hypothetical protein
MQTVVLEREPEPIDRKLAEATIRIHLYAKLILKKRAMNQIKED